MHSRSAGAVLALWALVAGCSYGQGARCIDDRDCDVGLRCVQDPPDATDCSLDGGGAGYAGPPTCQTYCRAPCVAEDAGSPGCPPAAPVCALRGAVQALGPGDGTVSAQTVLVCVPR